MNFLMVSPAYPPRVYFFASRLKSAGFTMLGLGDPPYANLHRDLKSCLRRYIRQDLDCYDPNGGIIDSRYEPLYKNVRKLAAEGGNPQYIESFNEWWLPLDARLRQDFGADGLKPADIEKLTRKSKMKESFQKAGAQTAPYELVTDEKSIRSFLKKRGGDIIAKPDRGLGSASTYRLRSDDDVGRFWQEKKPGATYITEQFIGDAGRQFMSFDGLTDKDGGIVFYTAHVYNDGDLEVATLGESIHYHNLRRSEIPAKFKDIGFAAVRAFGLRGRFFHMEFFRIGEDYYAVELNARPPGFFHLDMMNHASGIDIWAIYANVMRGENVSVHPARDKICMQIGRFNRIRYKNPVSAILKKYGDYVVYQVKSGVNLYGDWVCLVLTDDHERREEIVRYAVEERR